MIRKRMASIDDPVIYRLVVEQLVPFSRTYNAGASATFTQIRKRLNKNVTYVVAKGARKPFGFITVVRKSRTLYVDMLAVDPREQSRGWGRQLMNVAESYARAERCSMVELLVDDSNVRAYGFYTGRGYEVTQYLPEIACFKMSKTIM